VKVLGLWFASICTCSIKLYITASITVKRLVSSKPMTPRAGLTEEPPDEPPAPLEPDGVVEGEPAVAVMVMSVTGTGWKVCVVTTPVLQARSKRGQDVMVKVDVKALVGALSVVDKPAVMVLYEELVDAPDGRL
jgi:hypothetical protein